jgi:LysR family transcriptional regulator of gallate degradation
VNFRQLEFFLAVARTGSLTAAALELKVAQPTLTKSIHGLEQELGVKLFHRLPRGVQPTEYGDSLARHARQIQLQLREARSEIDGRREGDTGVVTIGAGPAWVRRHLPLAIARTMASRPRLSVRVVGGFDEALLRALRRGELDFVVAELPDSGASADLEVSPLAVDALTICAGARHPLAGERNVAVARLLDFPWILPSGPTRMRQRLEALFTTRGLPAPKPIVEADSMTFLLSLLRHSNGISYITEMTLRRPEGLEIKPLDVPELRVMREAGIVRRRMSWLAPSTEAVISELRAVCALEPNN